VGEELRVWQRMRGGVQARRRVCGGWCRVDWARCAGAVRGHPGLEGRGDGHVPDGQAQHQGHPEGHGAPQRPHTGAHQRRVPRAKVQALSSDSISAFLNCLMCYIYTASRFVSCFSLGADEYSRLGPPARYAAAASSAAARARRGTSQGARSTLAGTAGEAVMTRRRGGRGGRRQRVEKGRRRDWRGCDEVGGKQSS